MKKSVICLFALSSFFTTAAVFADESGSGKPQNSTTQQTSATTNCSWIETMLGRCANSEDDSEDTGVVSE